MFTAYERRFLAFVAKFVLLTGAGIILFLPKFGAEEPPYQMPVSLIALMETS